MDATVHSTMAHRHRAVLIALNLAFQDNVAVVAVLELALERPDLVRIDHAVDVAVSACEANEIPLVTQGEDLRQPNHPDAPMAQALTPQPDLRGFIGPYPGRL